MQSGASPLATEAGDQQWVDWQWALPAIRQCGAATDAFQGSARSPVGGWQRVKV